MLEQVTIRSNGNVIMFHFDVKDDVNVYSETASKQFI